MKHDFPLIVAGLLLGVCAHAEEVRLERQPDQVSALASSSALISFSCAGSAGAENGADQPTTPTPPGATPPAATPSPTPAADDPVIAKATALMNAGRLLTA